MTMRPGLRKFMLTVHLTITVAWLETIVVLLAPWLSSE
jgi:hypothetical protein